MAVKSQRIARTGVLGTLLVVALATLRLRAPTPKPGNGGRANTSAGHQTVPPGGNGIEQAQMHVIL